jgi:hypothetical protein
MIYRFLACQKNGERRERAFSSYQIGIAELFSLAQAFGETLHDPSSISIRENHVEVGCILYISHTTLGAMVQ